MTGPHPIKGVLAVRRITIRKAAANAGVNEGTLSRVLNGREAPWPALIARLSAYLDLPASELFLDETEQQRAVAMLLAQRAEAGLPPIVTDPEALRRLARVLVEAAAKREAAA